MAGEVQITCKECDRPPTTRGMCHMHYLRWWRETPKDDRPAPERRRITPAEKRFWAKVAKGAGCWEWQGCKDPRGYGSFVVTKGRTVPAHAFALELQVGYATPEGREACHRCDNPSCVNPRHIYYGTRQENVNDAWARGRHPIGSARAAAKLNEHQVLTIRERYARGDDAKELAKEFGIKVPTLRHIVLGLKWKHVGGPITRRRELAKKVA